MIQFGDVVHWREGGVIVAGRVTFVRPTVLRVVVAGACDQRWKLIDIGDLVDVDAEISGQMDIFGGVA